MDGARLVEMARSYEGVPWVNMGRDRHGLDCAGLIIVSLEDLGIADDVFGRMDPDPRTIKYSKGEYDRYFLEVMRKCGVRTTVEKSVDGDILLFADRLYPMHCGIRATRRGSPSVVHCFQRSGCVREHRLMASGQWRPSAAYRVPGID